MKKIPSLFVHEWANGCRGQVTSEVTPGCEWVIDGEGVPTVKYDGWCVYIIDKKMWKRCSIKAGHAVPWGFQCADIDLVTDERHGWVPVGVGPEDKNYREVSWARPDGTYELVGPKIQGNPLGLTFLTLIPHGSVTMPEEVPRDLLGLAAFLATFPHEGIVFWRDLDDPWCDKAKVVRRDFM